MVSVKVFPATCGVGQESITPMSKVEVPETVGVPVSAPLDESERPLGSVLV